MRVPPAKRAAFSTHDSEGEAKTSVCPQMRAAPSAHDGGDEADTCVCRPKMRALLSAYDT